MPVLENAKHEAYARGLAKGLPQVEAYAQAGYSPNAAAASRLASGYGLKARVEELKEEIHQKINQVMAAPNEEGFQSLKEMGLTMEWCAHAFKNIYEEALAAGQFAPANSAVSNIQKMIEIEGAGKGNDDQETESLIKISEATNLLAAFTDALNAAKGPYEIQDPADVAVDVTPKDAELVPSALIAQMEEVDDDDHPAGAD